MHSGCNISILSILQIAGLQKLQHYHMSHLHLPGSMQASARCRQASLPPTWVVIIEEVAPHEERLLWDVLAVLPQHSGPDHRLTVGRHGQLMQRIQEGTDTFGDRVVHITENNISDYERDLLRETGPECNMDNYTYRWSLGRRGFFRRWGQYISWRTM